MAQYINMHTVELSAGSAPVVPLGVIFEGDHKANRCGAIVTQNGAAYTLGGECAGTAVLADGSTVPLTGTISGNQAYVELDSVCYTVEGPISVFVKWVDGTLETTLIAFTGTVKLTETGAVIQPSTPISDIAQLLASIADMQEATAAAEAAATAAYTNFAPVEASSTASAAHPAGTYFILSGTLYRATADIASGGTIITSGTGQNCEAVTVGGELKRLEQDKAPVIVDDAYGAKASFSDAVAGLPLVSCLAQIDANLSGKTGCTVIRSATQNAQDGTAFSIAFGRTVYGGTVDAVTGVLTVTWKSITLNGTENWGFEPTAPGHWRFNVYLENAKVLPTYDTPGSVISNVYASSSPAETYNGTSGISLNAGSHILLLCDETYETVDALKAALAASNVQAVYQLETPEVYQLTPVEITALAGQNYIWADTGDTTVQYRIDTKAYIDKKFAALEALISGNA